MTRRRRLPAQSVTVPPGRDPGARKVLTERVKAVPELLQNPYLPRALLLVGKTPTKAAERLAWVRRMLEETDEGDVGWEAEEAALAKLLELADRCAACGRELSAGDSVERGLGPDCAAKLRAAQA